MNERDGLALFGFTIEKIKKFGFTGPLGLLVVTYSFP
jgi:hypothetical protein